MKELARFKFSRLDMTLEGKIEDGKLVFVIDSIGYPETCVPFNLNKEEAERLVSAIELICQIADEQI